MKIKLTEIEQLGHMDPDPRYSNQRRQTDEERKRPDIDPKALYLVNYRGSWLIGRFHMQWYGWNFEPNMGCMSMQIENLDEIYLIEGLKQEKDGSTAAHIVQYLSEEASEDD